MNLWGAGRGLNDGFQGVYSVVDKVSLFGLVKWTHELVHHSTIRFRLSLNGLEEAGHSGSNNLED
jgi:hypothetical protein